MALTGAQQPSDGSAARKPSPTSPPYRPTWLLVLASVTLIYGGLTLVSGLGALRDPSAAARLPPASRPLPPAEEALTRQLIAVNAQVVAAHARGIRGRAAASTLLALLMLYAAAAALSRDRHGRTVTLIAAWLGIAYQVGSLPVVIPIARDYATATGPLLAQLVVEQLPIADAAGAAGAAAAQPAAEQLKPEAIAGFMHSVFVAIPIATAVLGIIGSLLLIAYFGGRRGRALYGLGPAAKRR